MRYQIGALLMAVAFSVATVRADDKKAEAPKAPPPPPPPIVVNAEPAKIAEIDPKTLKVTYAKGADVKAFADQMVRAWANAQTALVQCQQQVQALQPPIKK